MFSNEEKEAIESLTIIKDYAGENYFFSKQGIKKLKQNINILLNLITKQDEKLKKQSYTNKKLRKKITNYKHLVKLKERKLTIAERINNENNN